MAQAVKMEETEVMWDSDTSDDLAQAYPMDKMLSAEEGWDPILDRWVIYLDCFTRNEYCTSLGVGLLWGPACGA